MTVPIPSSSPAGVGDADTAAVVHQTAGADADVAEVAATPRRLEWVLVFAVLAVSLGMTVALLVTLWLQPGSGSVGP